MTIKFLTELYDRNFEKEHVGKIKTVYPDAYELRQEKGLQNMQGFKQSGYQLTVEARLGDDLGTTLTTFHFLSTCYIVRH